jgi:hypothetical protein
MGFVWKGAGIMAHRNSSKRAAAMHNRMGCPFLNQTGKDAVLDWGNVLTRIDLLALPPELQAELEQLRLKYTGVDLPISAQ